MANEWYPKAFNHIGSGTDLLSEDVIFLLVTSGYTFDVADEFISDLGANIVGRTGNLTSKTLGTVGAGIFDAADTQFTALTGSAGSQLIMAIDSGNDATSPLLIQVDSTDYAGLPFTPTGANAPLSFPSGGIAQL